MSTYLNVSPITEFIPAPTTDEVGKECLGWIQFEVAKWETALFRIKRRGATSYFRPFKFRVWSDGTVAAWGHKARRNGSLYGPTTVYFTDDLRSAETVSG